MVLSCSSGDNEPNGLAGRARQGRRPHVLVLWRRANGTVLGAYSILHRASAYSNAGIFSSRFWRFIRKCRPCSSSSSTAPRPTRLSKVSTPNSTALRTLPRLCGRLLPDAPTNTPWPCPAIYMMYMTVVLVVAQWCASTARRDGERGVNTRTLLMLSSRYAAGSIRIFIKENEQHPQLMPNGA
jgi:hypothetical protein